MDSNTYTGEERSRFETAGSGQKVLMNTLLQDEKCDAYDVYGAGSETATVRYRPHARPPSSEVQQKVLPSERYALSKRLVQARQISKNMTLAASQDDRMELASQGIALLEELDSLWKLRHVREEPWSSVLNFLQSALTKKEFELYSRSQCEGIEKIVENHLAGGIVSEDDVPRVVKRLKDVELDPWRAISEAKELDDAHGNGSVR